MLKVAKLMSRVTNKEGDVLVVDEVNVLKSAVGVPSPLALPIRTIYYNNLLNSKVSAYKKTNK
jgi:hypothetical protein